MRGLKSAWQQERDNRTCVKCNPPHVFDTKRQLRYHREHGHLPVTKSICGKGHEHYSEGAVIACERVA